MKVNDYLYCIKTFYDIFDKPRFIKNNFYKIINYEKYGNIEYVLITSGNNEFVKFHTSNTNFLKFEPVTKNLNKYFITKQKLRSIKLQNLKPDTTEEKL